MIRIQLDMDALFGDPMRNDLEFSLGLLVDEAQLF
jgi:hypothetical protein